MSSRISENARIDVSGVRSSWVTVDTKSSLSRSSSCSRSLACRSSAVASSSCCDLRSSARLYARTCEVSSRICSTSSIPSGSSVDDGRHHQPGGGGPDRTGEHRLDVLDQLGVGRGVGRDVGSRCARRRPRARRALRRGPTKRAEQRPQLPDGGRAAPQPGVALPRRPVKASTKTAACTCSAGLAPAGQGQADEEPDVDEHAPHHGVADLVEPVEAEQGVRARAARPRTGRPRRRTRQTSPVAEKDGSGSV